MDLENEIDTIQGEMDELKIDKFRIGQQNYLMVADDPIFVSVGKLKETKKLAECYSCKLVTF